MPPFYNRDQKQMFKQILKSEIKFTDKFSPLNQNFIRQLLEKDPHKRLGFNGIHELKQHPWFGKIDFEKLYQKNYDLKFMVTIGGETDLSNFDKKFTENKINFKADLQ
jgi:serum/glucocorticoid-regulated kinase 2